MRKLLLLTFLFSSGLLFSQNYTSYLIGDAADVDSTSLGGYLLVGGGPDNDSAMTWFLQQANGGDVVVIRADVSSAYNQYLYDDLGVSVNSVETIVIPSASAANSQYVKSRLLEAEAIFIAGGDQTFYYNLWNNTYVDTVLSLSTTSSPVIGGTSAGMMILGDYDYYPTTLGVYSSEALSDPYHPYIDTIVDDGLIEKSKFSNLIFDSHFDNADRKGRLITFIARTMEMYSSKVSGIGLNEYTAIAITNDGVGQVYGDYPDYNDYAYFVATTCPLSWINYMPEVMEPETPLTWNYDGRALKVYKIPGTPGGNGQIDIETFDNESGGSWEYWYVDSGEVYVSPLNYEPDCFDHLSITENSDQKHYAFVNQNTIDFKGTNTSIDIYNTQGQLVLSEQNQTLFYLDPLQSGMYIIHYKSDDHLGSIKWVHP